MSPSPKIRAGAAPARHQQSSAAKPAAPDKDPLEPSLRAALTMGDVAKALSCSVPTVYRLIADGHLTTFVVGRRRYASPRAIHACVARLEELGAVLPAETGADNRAGRPSQEA